jgi:hypothetical protein
LFTADEDEQELQAIDEEVDKDESTGEGIWFGTFMGAEVEVGPDDTV